LDFSNAEELEDLAEQADVLVSVMVFVVCITEYFGAEGLTAGGLTFETTFKNLLGEGTKYEASINATESTAPLMLMTFS
jgi:hypothetical protein